MVHSLPYRREAVLEFIEQLARHIQRGRSLVREGHEDIGPAEADPPQAHAQSGTGADAIGGSS